MKKLLAIALLTASLAVSAKAVVISGFEIGYLTDSKEMMYSARLGYELKADTALSHQLEVEIGYSQDSESQTIPGVGVVSAKAKLMPLMLNYRAETVTTNKLGFYFGAGLGLARLSGSGSGPGISVSDSTSSFALQGFAGATYKASDKTSLHLGVKYLWINDSKLLNASIDAGDDLAVTAGISFKF